MNLVLAVSRWAISWGRSVHLVCSHWVSWIPMAILLLKAAGIGCSMGLRGVPGVLGVEASRV